MLIIIVMMSGCGDTAPQTNSVTGVVTLDGEPLPEVAVMFSPEPQEGKRTIESTALTDENGKYELVYTLRSSTSNTPVSGKGAIAGRHIVTVSDYKMMAEHLPRPGRVPLPYTKPSSTPLIFEVKEGPQSIDIRL